MLNSAHAGRAGPDSPWADGSEQQASRRVARMVASVESFCENMASCALGDGVADYRHNR